MQLSGDLSAIAEFLVILINHFNKINPLTLTVSIWVQLQSIDPVPDDRLNIIWNRLLHSCNHMAKVDVKKLTDDGEVLAGFTCCR